MEDRYVPPVPVVPHSVLWTTDVHLLQDKLTDRQKTVNEWKNNKQVNKKSVDSYDGLKFLLILLDGERRREIISSVNKHFNGIFCNEAVFTRRVKILFNTCRNYASSILNFKLDLQFNQHTCLEVELTVFYMIILLIY